MTIKVKVISKKNPRDINSLPRFYASAQHDAKIDLDGLATSVSDRCSLRRADVHGVLVALMDIIPQQLSEGKTIALGQLGTFAVNVKSNPADTVEQMSPKLVKGMKIQYRPTKELKKKLKMIDVSFAS